MRGWRPLPGRLWQRNYWEHVIRDDADHCRLYDYVIGNPGRWLDDDLHPLKPSRW